MVLFFHWKQIRCDLMTTFDLFQEAEITYMPFPGAWPVGEIILQITNTEQVWIQNVFNRAYGF
jgi:hypothetical protein